MEEDLEVGQLKCNRQKNTRQYCHTFPGAKVHSGLLRLVICLHIGIYSSIICHCLASLLIF